MSRTAQKLLSASGGKAYEIDSSLLCSSVDASKLRRTPSSEGNRRTFTFSTWCKRASLGLGGTAGSDYNYLMGAFVSAGGSTDDSHYFAFGFMNSDALVAGGWSTTFRLTNRLFRDTSAWYHLVLQVDTTQGTADNRVKLYVNGVQETSFSTSNNPSQNYDLAINNTVAQSISDTAYDSGTGPYHFDGYMAETHLFDGAVVAASEFGETDATTGQWIPKKYVGSSSYGTNGYYMPWKKNDRYSPYFNAHASSGILTADHADFAVGSSNFTMECWFYVDEYAGNYRRVFGKSSTSGANAHTEYQVDINASNQPVAYVYDAADSGVTYITLQSSTAITDNKWHHVALVRNGSAFNLYLDGTSVANATSSMTVNDSTYKFGIGRVGEYTGQIFKGWISNFRYVKGTAVYTSNFTPSTSPLTAITNTKLLCCQDATITTENSGTSKTLEVTAAQVTTHQMSPFTYDWYQDQSGQDNHYQPDNLTVNDVMLDSPTNNFPTLNSLMGNGASGYTYEQGSLRSKQSSLTSETAKSYSTMAFVSGKWYAEVACSSANVYTGHGVVNVSQSSEGFDFDSSTNNVSAFAWGDRIFKNGSQTQDSLNSTASSTNILGIALDLDNGTVQFYSNGSTSGSAETLTRNTGDLFVFCDAADSGGYASNSTYEWNFGQNGTHSGTKTAGGNADGNGIGNFVNSVPSGFLAPCSANLATPAVKKSTANFDIATYAGNGATAQEISLNFNPDLVWIKSRSDTEHHSLVDRVRGDVAVNSNQSIAEYAVANFDWNTNNTVDVPVYANDYSMNTSGDNYVMWHWKAGGSGSTNNDGAEASTVSVNTTAGFSIMKAEGTGSSTTYGHGLGVVPKVYIVKLTSDTGNWFLQTSALDGGWDYFQLNGTAAPASMTATAPTSSVITGNIASGETAIYYAWAEVEGFSRFGNYIGNGNTDGVFVNCGFRPAYVLFKNHGSSAWWWCHDTGRDPLNLNTLILFPNATTADYTSGSNGVDFLSNGIKLRADNDLNGSGQNVFFMAFAEFPFKYANAR